MFDVCMYVFIFYMLDVYVYNRSPGLSGAATSLADAVVHTLAQVLQTRKANMRLP
jgi:hypothetical protein